MPNTKADDMLDPLREELFKLRERMVKEAPKLEYHCNKIEDAIDDLGTDIDEHADCPRYEIE